MEDKEILKAFKLAIDAILDRLDEMDEMYHGADERMHKLESALYNEILEPVHNLFDGRQRNERRNAFNEKYKESLDPYCEDYKKLYGDDLDLYDDSFDEWDKLEDDQEKEEYIKKVMETIGKDRDRMKEKFGIKDEPVVEVTSVEVSDEDKDSEEDETEDDEWEETAKMLKKFRPM